MNNRSKFNPAVLPEKFMQQFKPAAVSEPQHFLYPGQVFVGREPMVISTILGSCAAVCLWDRHTRVGGMNHYLLPEGENEGPNRLRYGNVANAELLKQVLAMGCDIRNLQAKIFGGSNAFAQDSMQSLGTKNIRSAEEFLRATGIPVVAKDVSGGRGRRLLFQLTDGIAQIHNFGPASA